MTLSVLLPALFFQDAPADSGSPATMRIVAGVLALVLVVVLVLRRKRASSKEKEEDEF